MKIYKGISPNRIQLRTTSSFHAIKLASIYLPNSLILRIIFIISIPFLRFFQKGTELDDETNRFLDQLKLSQWREISIIKSHFSSRSICCIETKSRETYVVKFGSKTDQGLKNEINFYEFLQNIDYTANLLKPSQTGYTTTHAFLVFPNIRRSLFRKVKLEDWNVIEETLIELDVQHHDLNYWNVLRSRNSELYLIDWESWSRGKDLHTDRATFKKSIRTRNKIFYYFLAQKKKIVLAKKNFTSKNNSVYFFASQAISSTGNYLLNVFMAFFSLDPSQFGAFAFSFIVYILALGIFRALTTDPLLYAKPDLHSFSKNFIKPAIFNSLIISFFIAFFALQMDGQIGHFLLLLSFGLPGILIQDAFRFYFFSSDNAFGAFLLDLIWTSVFLFGYLAVYLEASQLSLSIIFLLWLFSANMLSLSLLVIFRATVRDTSYLLWYSARGGLFINSLIDYIVTYAAPSLFVLFLVRESSLNQVAGYRAATAILAIGAVAIASFSVSELRRYLSLQSSLGSFLRKSLVRVFSGPIFVICIIVATSRFLHSAFPVFFMGDSWIYAKSFIFPLALSYVFIALGTIPRVILKGNNQISILRKMSTPGFILVGGACLPVFQLYGLLGFTWLLTCSSALTLVFAYVFFRRNKIMEYGN